MAIRKFGVLGLRYRHARRYRQILKTLLKHGFGDLLQSLNLEHYLEVGRHRIIGRRPDLETLSRAKRVRMAVEELGPTFVKIGQILSTRPDLLPVEFLEEFEKLQDEVPPFPFSAVRETIEAELGVPLASVFRDFEQTPFGSASLGQAHRAQLAGGEQVVVKVQRPDLQKTVDVDLDIMLHLATLAERHLSTWEIQRPTRIVTEFARTLYQELDYDLEASHMERFAGQFIGDPWIYVPRVHRDFSTTRVLTMEYVDGTKASKIEELEEAGLDRREIARRGAELIAKQIFVHGFFHADPHPGNVFVLAGNVICFVDFGMMGRVGRPTREYFVDLMLSVAGRDETKAAGTLLKLTDWEDEPDRRLLEREVAEFMDRHLYGTLKDIELAQLVHQLLETASRYRLRIPSNLFLMLKTLSTAEGLGRLLDPDFNMMQHAAPFVARMKRQRWDPKRLGGEVVGSGREVLQDLVELPKEFRQLLERAKRGKLKLEIEPTGMARVLFTLERMSNRLAFAIVLAALVIGSALVVAADIRLGGRDVPLGLVGFFVAGLMGFWLLISILRRGRM